MNELKSYTEYAVSTPTADFVIGFDFNYGEDAVNVTVDDVPATEAGYTVVYLNETTIRLSPSVPSGVVRLQRETDIDQTDHAYRAGAKFIAQTMDENFEQLRHSQQEVRDGFNKLADDTYEIIDTLQEVGQAAQDAADAAEVAAGLANDAAAQVNDKVSYEDFNNKPHNAMLDRDAAAAHPTGAILDGSGETQQQVNYNGGSKWHSRVGGYKLNERGVLTNGDIIKSTFDGNSNDPNVDMTGWVNESLAIQSTVKNAFFTNARPYTESFSSVVDSAPFLKAYINSLNDGDTFTIPEGKWAIKSDCTINKAVNIKCDGELVVSGDSESVVKFEQEPSFTLTGANLTQLPKRGDTKLYVSGTPFDSAEYFFTLVSTEVEIVRIGYALPYYKNETLDFIDSKFNLRGQIDLDYTDASKLTIYVYKKRKSTRVQLNMSMQPNVGQTNGARIFEARGVNNVVWDVSIDRSSSQKVAGISFLYENCVHFTFMPNCKILGGQSDTSDSYAFLNSQSSYIMHFGGEYTDQGQTNKKERGYAGRHGKYVYFQKSFFNGIDDHYGHHYLIEDMIFLNRGIGISGGDVTIENCTQYNDADYLYYMRQDTPYCAGGLRLINCTGKLLLSLSSVNDPAYNSKFKPFDSVYIENPRGTIGAAHYINIAPHYAQNTNYICDKLQIVNADVKRNGGISSFISTDATPKFKKIIIDGFDLTETDLTTKNISINLAATESIELINCKKWDGSLYAPFIKLSGSKYGYNPASTNIIVATTQLIIDDSEITDAATAYASGAGQGAVYLYNSRINTTKFLSVNAFKTNVVASIGTTASVAQNIDFDLFNFNKNAVDRLSNVTLTAQTLSSGAVSTVATATVQGARLGDFVITSSTNLTVSALNVVAWVSAANTVSYYLKNDSAASVSVPPATLKIKVLS